jgi:hypothetical protein
MDIAQSRRARLALAGLDATREKAGSARIRELSARKWSGCSMNPGGFCGLEITQ